MKHILFVGLLVSLFVGTSYAGDYQDSGREMVDRIKEISYAGVSASNCAKIASIGETKGKKDRKVGIRDNNSYSFIYKICPKCGITTQSFMRGCYDNGYEVGYYYDVYEKMLNE